MSSRKSNRKSTFFGLCRAWRTKRAGHVLVRGSALVSLLLLLCCLGAVLLAGAHSWHDMFHDLGSNPKHQCLVTSLQTGQVDHAMVPESQLPQPHFIAVADRSRGQLRPVASDYFLLPERAPPA